MPLSAQEQQELDSLEHEVGHLVLPEHGSIKDLLLNRAPRQADGRVALDYYRATPESSREVLNAVAGSFLPAGTINPIRGLTTAAGDRLMQAATGIKKYIPGLGTKLVDEGIVGTKGMMQNQVQKKIAQQGDKLTEAVKAIPGKLGHEEAARAVDTTANKYITESGIVPEAVQPEYNKVTQTVQDIIGRGQVSPQEALQLKRIAQGVGYKAGQPLAKLESQLAQKEAGAYGQQLENAYAKGNPEVPNAVAEANAKLSTLLKGQQGLSRPDSIKHAIIGLKDLIASGVGTAVGGPVGGGVGYIASKALHTPAGSSLTAHALIKGGRAAGQASLLGAGRGAEEAANSQLSPQESDELQRLEQEVGHLSPR